MNRIGLVLGSCLAALGLIGVGHLYLTELSQEPQAVIRTPSAQKPREELKRVLTAEERVGEFLVRISAASQEKKVELLGGLFTELEGPEFAQARLSRAGQEVLAEAVLGVVSGLAEGPETLPVRQKAVLVLASRTDVESSRAFIEAALENGPQELRTAALKGLGSPGGLRGKTVYAKVLETSQKGLAPGTLVPQALRRTGGKEGSDAILELMRSTSDWTTINACAVALQDYQKPGVIGEILARLEAVGSLEDPKRLPWFGRRLFGEWLKTAEGADFSRGLKVMKEKPTLVKGALDAAEKALGHSDPVLRGLAGEAIERAVEGRSLDPETGEKLLSGRLGVETEPMLRAQLSGGLEKVRDMLQPAAEEIPLSQP